MSVLVKSLVHRLCDVIERLKVKQQREDTAHGPTGTLVFFSYFCMLLVKFSVILFAFCHTLF